MVKLFCALVGVKGNAFSVTIDASDFVDDLKDAIKAKKENDLMAVGADKLQLFLARKGDSTWLDRSGAEAVTLDENGYPEGFTHMDPLLWIKNPANFGERFEPNEGEIHVLVVVPTDLNTFSPYAAVAATLLQHTFFNVPSTPILRTQKLKKQLVKDYKCDCGRNQNGDSMLLCMVMNIGLPSPVVIASHIFRQEHNRLKGDFVQIEDIDDVRNGLLLFKPIESAFDDLDIAFLVDKQDQFTLKIFNPMIKTQLLVDSLTQQQWDVLGGGSVPAHWRLSTSPIYAPNAPQFNVLTTFGELDGKALRFPSGSTLRPFRRCLYHQAQLARAKAITQGWVPKDYNFDDISLEGLEKMRLPLAFNLNIFGSPP